MYVELSDMKRHGSDPFSVQLWTTGNWHWYLKFELQPLGSPRFLSVAWHPEEARTLLVASEGKYHLTLTKAANI